jgi:hypothetical protein
MSKKTGANKNSSLRQQSTMDFIRSALGSTQREPGWEYGEILPVRARKNDKGEMEREWGLGYSNTAKGMMDALTLPRRALEGEEVTPEKAMEMAMNVTAPGVATARYAPNVLNMPMVYHGTPHRFPATEANPLGEFDASKIGTGEGAQMYGHGIYLAEKPGVAENYMQAGNFGWPTVHVSGKADKEFHGFGPEADDFFDSTGKEFGELTGAEAKRLALLNAPEDVIEKYKNIPDSEFSIIREKGNFYKADLPDEMVGRMLDWDKPLIEQPAIHDSIEKLSDAGAIELFEGITGGQLLEQMDRAAGFGSKGVASLLRQAGIPGIKYLDQGSRDSGEGTRNFVIFPGEEKKVKILERK